MEDFIVPSTISPNLLFGANGSPNLPSNSTSGYSQQTTNSGFNTSTINIINPKSIKKTQKLSPSSSSSFLLSSSSPFALDGPLKGSPNLLDILGIETPCFSSSSLSSSSKVDRNGDEILTASEHDHLHYGDLLVDQNGQVIEENNLINSEVYHEELSQDIMMLDPESSPMTISNDDDAINSLIGDFLDGVGGNLSGNMSDIDDDADSIAVAMDEKPFASSSTLITDSISSVLESLLKCSASDGETSSDSKPSTSKRTTTSTATPRRSSSSSSSSSTSSSSSSTTTTTTSSTTTSSTSSTKCKSNATTTKPGKSKGTSGAKSTSSTRPVQRRKRTQKPVTGVDAELASMLTEADYTLEPDKWQRKLKSLSLTDKQHVRAKALRRKALSCVYANRCRLKQTEQQQSTSEARDRLSDDNKRLKSENEELHTEVKRLKLLLSQFANSYNNNSDILIT